MPPGCWAVLRKLELHRILVHHGKAIFESDDDEGGLASPGLRGEHDASSGPEEQHSG